MTSLLAWWWLATAPAAAASCPADMVHVRGTHHEEVQRVCDDYRKSKCWSFLPGF